jgi:P4 family phage/plasmid primase-like protien
VKKTTKHNRVEEKATGIKIDENINKIDDVNNDPRMESYLNCLNNERFEKYDDWIKIGLIIFNENGSCELFDKFSRKGSNYDNSCFSKWKTFKKKEDGNAVTIQTLMDMAKRDNPEMFYEVLRHDKEGILNDIFYNGLTDITCSHLFYCLYPNDYIYDYDNEVLYRINQYGIYEKDQKFLSMKDHINKTLFRIIEANYTQRVSRINNEEIKANTMKIFLHVRKYLLTSKNKDHIVNELILFYKKTKIYEKLDNVNNYILSFNNGVYDFKSNQFRNAKPEELVTCTTGYSYVTPDPRYVDEVHALLTSIMPNVEEKKYLLKTISLGLIGDNLLEEFYIWIGTGANGKGILRDIIAITFGEYFDSLEIEYLGKTKHQGHANSADPVMARKKNCRIVISTEPEGDVNLKCGRLKQISGRDPVQSRDLYKSSFNFVPKFKLIIQTNVEVGVDGHEPAIVRRLRFIPFPNTFVDDPKLPNERKIDRTLKERIKGEQYRLAFFHILLDHYREFVEKDGNKLEMPERIKQSTKNYLCDNDPVQQFIDNRLEKTSDKNDTIKSSNMYDLFKSYYDDDVKVMSIKMFKCAMQSKGFVQKRTNKSNIYQYVKHDIHGKDEDGKNDEEINE